MDRLNEIKQRWDRINKNKYGLGRVENLEVKEPVLVIASDRPTGDPEMIGIVAVLGPVNDPDSLEDAIAFMEAGKDIQYLLDCVTALESELRHHGDGT